MWRLSPGWGYSSDYAVGAPPAAGTTVHIPIARRSRLIKQVPAGAAAADVISLIGQPVGLRLLLSAVMAQMPHWLPSAQ